MFLTKSEYSAYPASLNLWLRTPSVLSVTALCILVAGCSSMQEQTVRLDLPGLRDTPDAGAQGNGSLLPDFSEPAGMHRHSKAHSTPRTRSAPFPRATTHHMH